VVIVGILGREVVTAALNRRTVLFNIESILWKGTSTLLIYKQSPSNINQVTDMLPVARFAATMDRFFWKGSKGAGLLYDR
jgi:hypothetical protein